MRKLTSNNSDRRPWSIPEECKEEIREMLADGLTTYNVAWYIGVSNATVENIQDHDATYAKQKKYYLKNRVKLIRGMKIYNKKRKAIKKPLIGAAS